MAPFQTVQAFTQLRKGNFETVHPISKLGIVIKSGFLMLFSSKQGGPPMHIYEVLHGDKAVCKLGSTCGSFPPLGSPPLATFPAFLLEF